MKNKILNVLKIFLLSPFVVITYWEILLYISLHSNLNNFNIWSVLFIIPIATTIMSLVGWSKKTHNFEYILILFAISILYLGNLIYYRTFGSLLSVSMIGAGGDAITNFWWSISQTIKENILVIILFELPIVLIIVLSINKMVISYKWWVHPILLVSGIAIWFLVVLCLPLTGTQDHSAYGAYHSRFVDTDTASRKLGMLTNMVVETKYAIFGSNEQQMIEVEQEEEIIIEEPEEIIEYNKYDYLDINKIKENSDNQSIINICDYLNTQTPTTKNEYTGMFEGYNLIYICAESFSRLAIDPEITPTLYKLANNGIVLNNYYNAFKNVTTNGEYALLTGLWPDTAREETNMGKLTGTMGQSIDKTMSECLGNKFKEIGLNPYGYHNYYGYYYGRNKTLPNMGFTCKFMKDGMTFSTSWPASDLEMMEQSIPDFINDKQFLAYYMTFSGHGNYTTDNVICAKNIDYVLEKTKGRNLPTSAQGYYACNYELELAMQYLLDELDKAGKLDKTVIVLTGDHYPYYLTDAGYKALNGEAMSDDFEDYHSTCIIYNSAMDKIEVDTPCCNTDILPTILNLFNINYDSRLYAGTDIFSSGNHVAMLYNKSFISEDCKYNAATGKVIWLKNYENMKHVDKYNTIVKNKYIFSIMVEETDFYQYLHN